MAADSNLLQGQVTEDPATEKRDVDALLNGLLQALLAEQRSPRRMSAPKVQLQAEPQKVGNG